MFTHVEVSVHGPVFDGRAELAVHDFQHQCEQHVADIGVTRVKSYLDMVLRHQTGRYVGGVHTDRSTGDITINDARVVYGPWLEGVGSRNSPVTRFPGYHSFRIASQQLDSEAEGIANAYLHTGGFLARMN
jgi:hypothetical protein